MDYVNKNGLSHFWQSLKTKLSDKVDKEEGKGLSSNDYTKEDKEKLKNLSSVKYKAITLSVENWVESDDTYIYTVEDDTVTASDLIEGHLDLENQSKLSDGYIDSFDGGYKIVTSEIPTDEIVMNISIQKVVV